jgi:hypothetical protein
MTIYLLMLRASDPWILTSTSHLDLHDLFLLIIPVELWKVQVVLVDPGVDERSYQNKEYPVNS